MRIIVTGAAGFMGSHLLELLIKEGHEVLGIDDYSTGTYKHPNIINASLLDKDFIQNTVKEFKPEILYHLASWAHEGLSQFAPIKITENNYNAYLNILVPCINSGIKRVVCCSSMSVYGDQEPPFDESMETKPEDIYAISKDSMEKATEILADVHGFEYVIIRPHNVYGERQALHDPYRNVIAIFMNRVMKGLPPIIYGDGKQTRAFSYIADVNPYMAKAGFSKEVVGETINIGPTKEYSINYLAEVVLRAFKSDLKPIHYPDRPREVKHAYTTNEKAQRLLGYKTTTPFEVGINKMAKWALSEGTKEFVYLDKLELTGKKVPKTWLNKEM